MAISSPMSPCPHCSNRPARDAGRTDHRHREPRDSHNPHKRHDIAGIAYDGWYAPSPHPTIRAHPPHPLMRVIHHPVGGGSIPVRIEFSGHLGTLGFYIVETRPRVPVRAITATRVLERTGSRGCQPCVTIRASPPVIPRVRWRYRAGIVIIEVIRVLHGDIGIQGGKIGLTGYGSTAITIGTVVFYVMRPV